MTFRGLFMILSLCKRTQHVKFSICLSTKPTVKFISETIDGKNWQLLTDEPVEFEKQHVEVQGFRKIIIIIVEEYKEYIP